MFSARRRPADGGMVVAFLAPMKRRRDALGLASPFVCLGMACSVRAAGGEGPSAAAVDRVDPAPGVPARGYEPAVVSLEVGGVVTCAGALVASDVVITARHCVSRVKQSIDCASEVASAATDIPPAEIAIRVGDDSSAAVRLARGRAILVPSSSDICTADLALLLIDSAVDTVAPFRLRATGVAASQHVRSVAWWGSGLLLRDHVLVVATSAREIRLDEPERTFAAGGPALDEATGALIGIASRFDGSASAGGTVYVRADAFASLFDEAKAQSTFGSPTTGTHLLKANHAPADLGATCTSGADCAAGDCVELGAGRYCSRDCGPQDRCPADYRCERAQGGGAVCIKT
jgi:hypothetical protein